jgi:hypothetical protein
MFSPLPMGHELFSFWSQDHSKSELLQRLAHAVSPLAG